VTRSTKQDKMKLDRVMGYLRRTPNQTIVFRPGHLGIMPRQYVDASYGVHMDGKSHTGACIIIGDTGAVFNKSSKQSIVTKSSTKAELVAGSDALNQLLQMPTKMMIANVLTKSLQGKQFRTETAMITGNEIPRATESEGEQVADA
jgi:hypothetical protein